jgi:hypothetical protein
MKKEKISNKTHKKLIALLDAGKLDKLRNELDKLAVAEEMELYIVEENDGHNYPRVRAFDSAEQFVEWMRAEGEDLELEDWIDVGEYNDSNFDRWLNRTGDFGPDQVDLYHGTKYPGFKP